MFMRKNDPEVTEKEMLQQRINKTISKLECDIDILKHNKKCLLNIEPTTNVIEIIDYEIKEKERLIYMLKEGQE